MIVQSSQGYKKIDFSVADIPSCLSLERIGL